MGSHAFARINISGPHRQTRRSPAQFHRHVSGACAHCIGGSVSQNISLCFASLTIGLHWPQPHISGQCPASQTLSLYNVHEFVFHRPYSSISDHGIMRVSQTIKLCSTPHIMSLGSATQASSARSSARVNTLQLRPWVSQIMSSRSTSLTASLTIAWDVMGLCPYLGPEPTLRISDLDFLRLWARAPRLGSWLNELVLRISDHELVLRISDHELVLRNSDLECPHLGSGARSTSQTMSFSDYELTLRISDHETLRFEMSWACIHISDLSQRSAPQSLTFSDYELALLDSGHDLMRRAPHLRPWACAPHLRPWVHKNLRRISDLDQRPWALPRN